MASKIAQGFVVTMAYDIRTVDGKPIESSEKSGPLTFTHGQKAMLPGLDAKLEGLTEGTETEFTLEPEEAFGRIADAPTKIIPRNEFPAKADIQPGMSFEAGLPGGQAIQLSVKRVDADYVTVKMLHPLAGQKIAMKVKILTVRPPESAS